MEHLQYAYGKCEGIKMKFEVLETVAMISLAIGQKEIPNHMHDFLQKKSKRKNNIN